MLSLFHSAQLAPAVIIDLSNVGTNIGIWTGDFFLDNCPSAGTKHIPRVVVRAYAVVKEPQLEYTDASVTAARMDLGSKLTEFMLSKAEGITQAWFRSTRGTSRGYSL